MRWYFFFFFFLSASCFADPVYKIAWQAPRGQDAVFHQFNETFAYVGQRVGATFQIFPFEIDADLQTAAAGFDFFYGGPTLLYCVILTNNIQPLATLISNVNGRPVSVLSGSIITLPSSDIDTLSQIEGKRVATGQFTGLTTFQSELYLLLMNNISLFTQTKAIIGLPDTPSILNAVMTGQADVGFTQTQAFPSSVSIVAAQQFPNQYLPSTTTTYSSQVFAAAKNISNQVRTAVAEALLAMPTEAPGVLQRGNYSGWNVPQSFIDIRRLGQATGLISPTGESCTNLTMTFAFIKCPPGFYRRPDSALKSSCQSTGYVCPPYATCICSPCSKIIPPKHVGSLGLGEFCAILVAIALAGVLICLIVVMRHRHKVDFISWGALNVDPSAVLGQTSKGLVLKGRYKNRPVACKRAYPRSHIGVSVFDVQIADTFTPTSICLGITLYGAGENIAALLGIPTALSRRGKALTDLEDRDHPNILSVLGASKGADNYELIAVTEFAQQGTLQDLLDNKSIDVPPRSLLKLALDVARGLSYLHSLAEPCVGTKLKPSSILVTEAFVCQLAPDVSRSIADDEARLLQAPEVLRGGDPSPSADMYSFGMLLYHITHRQEAFADCDASFVAKGICDLEADEIIRPVITRTDLDKTIVDFMGRCWRDNPGNRPSAQDAVDLLLPYSEHSLAGHLLLEASQQRALLQQILPDHVTKALQEGRTPSARTFDMVTIFFSDIKGFTSISSTQTPKDVMRMLDELYKKFDALCNKHNLMKVETIGDAYMLVGGIRVEKEHAARVARFALEAVEAAHTVKLPGGMGTVKIRAGFHSGAVTSGVVGSEVPRYCLFGDSVNTASRMESTGVVDRIQMSSAAAQLVKEQDPVLGQRIHSRAGMVTPKGKTAMQTFWLFTDDDMRQVQTRVVRMFKRNSEGSLPVIEEAASRRARARSMDGIAESQPVLRTGAASAVSGKDICDTV